MVGFEEVNGVHARTSPIAGFAGRAASVTGDVLGLAELQVKLVKADATVVAKRAAFPLILLLLAICMALASLPVLALGAALGLANFTEIADWQAFLIVGSTLATIACVTLFSAVSGLRKSLTQFQRSSTELAKNVVWLKAIAGKGEPE